MTTPRRALLTALLATGATALAGCSLLPGRRPTDQATASPPQWALSLADVPGATSLEVWGRLPYLTAGHHVEWALSNIWNVCHSGGESTVIYSAGEAKVYETRLVMRTRRCYSERLPTLVEAVAASDGTTTDHLNLDMLHGPKGSEQISTTKDLAPPLYGFTSWVTREDGSHGVIERVYAPTTTRKDGRLGLIVLTTVSAGQVALEPHPLDLLPTALRRADLTVTTPPPAPSTTPSQQN